MKIFFFCCCCGMQDNSAPVSIDQSDVVTKLQALVTMCQGQLYIYGIMDKEVYLTLSAEQCKSCVCFVNKTLYLHQGVK